MGTIQTLLEILKYTLPALIVLLASYLIVQKFLVAYTERKHMALFKDTQDITLRLRLQAYERLVMFIERIHPTQIIPRVYDSSMTVQDLQHVLVMTIRAEYEHNLTQQIYVSKNAWETVKNVKEQEINMVHNISKTLKSDAPAKELHARILDYVYKTSEDGELPTDIALHILNEDVRRVMTYGAI
ncbi:MAG: hypothetical protein JWQ38_3082 [Flavipsychrobacter sp.]|nr:hypothetical protein [Flavipsychrobacter sp.]